MFSSWVGPREYWLFGMLALAAWTVGGYADGISAPALVGVPLLIGLWIGAVVAIDSQVKND